MLTGGVSMDLMRCGGRFARAPILHQKQLNRDPLRVIDSRAPAGGLQRAGSSGRAGGASRSVIGLSVADLSIRFCQSLNRVLPVLIFFYKSLFAGP
jgi:hypothetical protein